MKHAFLSRRHRNPHQHDEQQKEQPFFSKSNEKERQPFFPAAGHEQPAQTKLAIGQPGDKYEQEADAVANRVVKGQNQTPAVQRRGISAIQRSDLATPVEDEKLSTAEARMEKDKLIQEKAGATEEKKKKPVQMQTASGDAMEDKKKKPVQMAPAPLPQVQRETEGGGTTASAQLSSRIQDSSGKGKPLPGKTRAEMESAIGTDFSGVNIHTDGNAVEMNEKLGAQAFTHGHDVYFNSGKYHPESAQGRRLLAHELTHVVQQTGNDRVSLDRASTADKSVGVKNTLKSSFIFSGSTKFQDALITIGDLNAAVKHGDCSLSELVIILNHNKFPKTGEVIQGDRYNFQIVSADAKKLSISRIKIIKKQ
jgi:hypothetical protein